MRKVIQYLSAIRIRKGAELVLLCGLMTQGCAAILHGDDLRATVQNHIKEKVAKIDTIGSMKVGYVTTEEMESRRYLAEQSSPAKDSNFGAFVFTKIGDKERNAKVYTLYEHEGNFMAETKVSEKPGQKTFFGFGLNKDTKLPAISLRVEF